jgi:acyl-CoA hydrolase
MTEIVMPNDANPLGTIFGGRVMQLMDIAASITCFRHARCNVVTASVDSLEFKGPIHVGEAIVVRSWLNWVGRSSMEAQVEVLSENLLTGERRRTSTAYLTMVAVDGEGQPQEVPRLDLESDEERLRYRQAAERRQERLRLRSKHQSEEAE